MLAKFGDVFFMSGAEKSILITLLVVAIVCTVAVIAMWSVAILLLKRRKATPKRELKEISVDVSEVKREFMVGEEFVCNGLLVKAIYNSKPKKQTLDEYQIVTQEELAQLEERGEASDCYVIRPSLSEIGDKTVTVMYMGKTASYTVSVTEAADQ